MRLELLADLDTKMYELDNELDIASAGGVEDGSMPDERPEPKQDDETDNVSGALG